jgi:hypothetical protein
VRSSTIAVLVAACTLSVPTLAGASQESSRLQGGCGSGALVVLFWPHGHAAIASVGFPRFRKPHVEIYRFDGARTYRPANFVGYVGIDGKPTLKCKAPPSPSSGKPIVPRRSSSVTAAISCGFQGAATVQIQRLGGPWHARIFDVKGLVVDVTLAPGGSTVSAATSRCNSGAVPR